MYWFISIVGSQTLQFQVLDDPITCNAAQSNEVWQVHTVYTFISDSILDP